MALEQTGINSTTTQQTASTSVTPEVKPEVQAELKPFRVFADELEYKKELQSASSKAKNDIMKELGIQSVEEVKALRDSHVKLQKDHEKLETDVLLSKLGIKEDNVEDFLVLAKAKVSKEMNLEAAARAVLEKHPSFSTEAPINPVQPAIKVGTGKATQPVTNPQMNPDLLAKWGLSAPNNPVTTAQPAKQVAQPQSGTPQMNADLLAKYGLNK